MSVRHALRAHVPAAIDSLCAGFVGDPFYEWFFPDPTTFDDFLRRIMTMYVSTSIQAGNAWVLPDGDDIIGAACWGPAGAEPSGEGEEVYLTVAQEANPGRIDEVMAGLMEVMAVRPAEPEHWYLAAVATIPEHRGQGHGQVLLTPILATLDAEGVPAYLESSNPRNVPFYERLGFTTQHEIRLPGGGPAITTMWREPNTGGTSRT